MKYTEIRLVKYNDRYQIRFEGEIFENGEIFQNGGILFDVFHIDNSYVLCKIINGHPFKICSSIQDLISFLRDKTGLMLKHNIQ